MQKVFNSTVAVVALLCMFSFAMPTTYSSETSYVGQLTDTVSTITSLGGSLQDTLYFFTDTLDLLVNMGTSLYNWIVKVVDPVIDFLTSVFEWFTDAIYNILAFFRLDSPNAPNVDPLPEFDESTLIDGIPPGILPDYDVA